MNNLEKSGFGALSSFWIYINYLVSEGEIKFCDSKADTVFGIINKSENPYFSVFSVFYLVFIIKSVLLIWSGKFVFGA